MSEGVFKGLMAIVAVAFSLFFFVTMVPALLSPEWTVLSGILGGFVNPFAAGYSTDVILCWIVLTAWIVYERQHHGVKHGWVCVLLGAMPGVVVGFALYLILRMRQNIDF